MEKEHIASLKLALEEKEERLAQRMVAKERQLVEVLQDMGAKEQDRGEKGVQRERVMALREQELEVKAKELELKEEEGSSGRAARAQYSVWP
jgi:hypothetical protein